MTVPRGPRALLLQRDAELAALARHRDRVLAGSGCLAVVEGPAGIGKSSLLAASGRAAEASGMRVLRAWGGPLEQDAGWDIARQLFGPVLGGAEWDELAVGAAALARRALDPDTAAPALAGDAMHAAAHGLTWLACGLADRAPTLLVVDDVHWADLPSLRWLTQLTRRLGELRLGILCATRSGEAALQPDMLGELLAAAQEPPVWPSALELQAVARLVGELLPTVEEAFARSCHAATAGNPFLLRALVGHLVAEQTADGAVARLSTFGSEQVARSVEAQLGRLPAGARDLARAFAVLGRSAPLRHARALAGLDATTGARLADRLRAAGLLGGDTGAYKLVHPLVASTLNAGMPHAERALWHARAAELLMADRADPEAVALHVLRSEPVGEAATVELLRTAARGASVRGAPESAWVFLRRALAEPPPDDTSEAQVRSELGLALAAHVQPGAREELKKAVRLARSPNLRARTALSGARALGLAGHFDDAVDLCRSVVDAPEGVAPELLAPLEAELLCTTLLHASTVAAARALLHRRIADPDASPMWGILAAWDGTSEGRPAAETSARLTAAVASGVLDDHPDSLLGTIAKLMLVHSGDPETAAERCGALIDVARPRGWLIALAHGSFLRAFALIRAGRVREAEADARLAFDFKMANSPPAALVWGLLPLVDALTELDELIEAEAVLAAAHLRGDPPPDGLSAPLLWESRARLRLAQLRPAEAHADLGVAADAWERLGVRHPGIAAWRVADCEALVALDDVRAARPLAEAHIELADRTGLPEPRAAGLRALALTAGPRDAVALLEQAVALLNGNPARLEHARTLVALGTALRRARQPAAARDPLRRGLDLAERGGMRLLTRRARHELHATGARPRRDALFGVDSLTPAELRVAALAARGHGNRAIAQDLYITRGTVETHLTHVFQKLGVGNRTELASHLPAHTAES